MLQLVKNILTVFQIWVAGLSILAVLAITAGGFPLVLVIITVLFLMIGNGLLGIVSDQIKQYILTTTVTSITVEREEVDGNEG